MARRATITIPLTDVKRIYNAGKRKKQIRVNGIVHGRKRRKNVAAGFYDEDGYFHPIRASYDYSRSRAGEGAKKSATKKSIKKKRK